MSRKQVIAALAFAAIGTAAFAQEATSDTWTHARSFKSRQEVRAELSQARQDGTLQKVKAGYLDKIVGPGRARDEVRAEAIAARRSGEQQAIDSEAYAFVPSAAPLTLVARKH
jgi:hypothetical protein